MAKPLSTHGLEHRRPVGAFSGVGKLSHMISGVRRSRALDQGLSYRQVQMMSGPKNPQTVMRFDHRRENLDQNAANHLKYE